MSDEVLYMLVLSAVAAIAGRVAVSKKDKVKESVDVWIWTLVFLYINYITFFDHWLITALIILSAYFVGFAGKDSLKLFLRRRVRPQAKQAVGHWQPKETVDEEDHSHTGIGS